MCYASFEQNRLKEKYIIGDKNFKSVRSSNKYIFKYINQILECKN